MSFAQLYEGFRKVKILPGSHNSTVFTVLPVWEGPIKNQIPKVNYLSAVLQVCKKLNRNKSNLFISVADGIRCLFDPWTGAGMRDPE
jgi:hypothetical protein